MTNENIEDGASILERYLANLRVEVEPFALCMLQSGWRLSLPGLEVPHAAMHQRVFVLRPLCDIAATEEVPALGARVEELLRRMLALDKIVRTQ